MSDAKHGTAQEKRPFKAEVRQVLDIVIHSLYTNREIFIRELVSNASDALEKMRHEALVQKQYADRDAPLEIHIATDADKHTLTITDTGVGMTRDELVNNLGTIARSGTREFIERLSDDGSGESAESDLIGKFGVGFYSSFMAADEVRVRSRSFKPNAVSCEWHNDGVGEYTITSLDEDLPRGTSVILSLSENSREFEKSERIREIVRTYSNFVPFPIHINGERVNTVQAIWTKTPADVTEEEYTEFFKFLAATEDAPMYHLHTSADAPLQLSSILYVPARNLEMLGLFRIKPQVNLYCHKVLVEQHTDKLLPEYLRFVTGVVDSADLTLNISRETLQDSLVFKKLGSFLTKRFIRFLDTEAGKNPESYAAFWAAFGTFIKEGVVADFEHRDDLAKLLRFASSATEGEGVIPLAGYVGRMKEDQKDIYYINGRSREDIESGPFAQAFLRRGIEVLYLYDPVDDFVMTSLGEFEGKRLVSADSASVDLPSDSSESSTPVEEINSGDVAGFTEWVKETLGNRVAEVRTSSRPGARPALVLNPDDGMTTTMRRILKNAGRGPGFGDARRILELNPRHSLIVLLKKHRDGATDKGFLQECVRQIYDTALAEAGLLDQPAAMADRAYRIMERALGDSGTPANDTSAKS